MATEKEIGSVGPEVTELQADASLAKAKSYKLVKSDTSNNLYVETKDYDPLEHHRNVSCGFHMPTSNESTWATDAVCRYTNH
jgi:hypothetical protein